MAVREMTLRRYWKIVWLSGLGVLAAPAAAEAVETWEISAGPGFVMTPRDLGSRHERYLPIPDLAVTWRNRLFFDGRRGFGAYAWHDDDSELGASLGFRTGRNERHDARLRGLGKIDDAATANLFGRLRVAGLVDVSLTLSRDLGGSEGTTGSLDVGSYIPFTERFTLIPTLTATLQDRTFARRWFGIDAAQSQRSGLPEYAASDGIQSWAATAVLIYQLSPRWSLAQTLSLAYLAGPGAHSPVTDLRLQPTVAVSLSYRFRP